MRLFSIFCVIFLLCGCTKVDSVVTESIAQDGGEYWETLSIDGRRIGFQRTAFVAESRDGKPMERFELRSRLTVLRHGSLFDVSMKLDSLSEVRRGDDHTGKRFFDSCTLEFNSGGQPIETVFRLENGRLIVSSNGHETSYAWPTSDSHADVAGPDGLIRSLLDKPMTPGEERRLTFFDPSLFRFVSARLEAEKIESVVVEGKNRNLLRISVHNQFEAPNDADATPTLSASSESLSVTLWTDAGGNIMQGDMPTGDFAMNTEDSPNRTNILLSRVAKDVALASIQAEPEVDLGHLGVVSLDRPILAARQAPRLTFIVRMPGGNSLEDSPIKHFPNTAFQQVSELDRNTAKIVVWSVVGLEPTASGSLVGNPAFERIQSEARPEDTASTRLIDPDDPELQNLVDLIDANMTGTVRTPWETALACEKLVHDTIRKTSFSIAFASSSDVLKAKSGDCTEFAVLLAALCRAKNIPCRLVVGLVYTPFLAEKTETPEKDGTSGAGMAFHLWNEVLIDGHWQPLDATLALGGADAARIKIADDSLIGDSLGPLTQSILGVVGKLQINVAR